MIAGCTREDHAKTAAAGVADVNLEQSIQARFAWTRNSTTAV